VLLQRLGQLAAVAGGDLFAHPVMRLAQAPWTFVVFIGFELLGDFLRRTAPMSYPTPAYVLS
jgi:hypothetical protein